MCHDISTGAVDLNAAIEQVERLLRFALGETVPLQTKLDPELSRARIDSKKLNWILMSLAMKAHTVVGAGGQIVISTASVALDGAAAEETGLPAGGYAQLEFMVTKGGMTASAPVREIVQRSGGAISVRSVPPDGASVVIVLPQATLSREVRGATPVILVVEDEPAERALIASMLASEGYDLLEARDGVEAEAFLGAFQVDMMITDIVMPERDGLETIKLARKSHPGLKIIAMTGAPDDNNLRVAKLLGADSVLSKPLERDALMAAIRKEIGG